MNANATLRNKLGGWVGKVCALPLMLAVWSAQGAQTTPAGTQTAPAQEDATARQEQQVEQEVEEVVVTEERLRTAIPTVELIQATYEARYKGGRLYRLGQYEEALPLLLVAARKGFKMEQARVSFLYQQGLGTEQDVEAAVGWLGVAARGETTPEIRGRFKEIWARIPQARRSYFEEVIDEYEKRYGNEANRTACKNRMEANSLRRKRIFECDFMEAEMNGGIMKPFRF